MRLCMVRSLKGGYLIGHGKKAVVILQVSLYIKLWVVPVWPCAISPFRSRNESKKHGHALCSAPNRLHLFLLCGPSWLDPVAWCLLRGCH